MKVSHMIMKVENLDKAVAEYRAKGFEVEYGKSENPINALIFFSEGPYIELLASSHMPDIVKKIGRLIGKGSTIDRVDFWDKSPAGEYCGLALETYASTLEKEVEILKKHGFSCMQMNNRRDDTKGRSLRFKTGYPNDLELPFLMTYFNIDPKPENFVHPNGVQAITKVRFGTRADLVPVIQELCDDPVLELFVGNGISVERK